VTARARPCVGVLGLAAIFVAAMGGCGGAGATAQGPGSPASPDAPGGAPTGATPSSDASSSSTSPAGSALPASAESESLPGGTAAAPPRAAAEVPPTEEELTFSTGGTGKLPATTIRKVLRDKMPAYIACYEKARERTPDLKGRFAAAFRIESSGAVRTVEMRGSRKDAAFSSCLADEVKALKFPKPKGGVVEVVYPLDFSGD